MYKLVTLISNTYQEIDFTFFSSVLCFFLSFLEKGQSEACVCYGIQQTFVGFLNVIVKVWGGKKREFFVCSAM